VVEPQSWGLAVSRYIHLNPLRIQSLGLGKQHRSADRQGFGAPPKPEIVKERVKALRAYRWSSYRSYIGREKKPEWLTCLKVLELGGKGTLAQRQEAYRRYVEEAVREGLADRPWEEAIGGLVLGSREFLAKARRGLGIGREQPQSRDLQPRPEWREVIKAVESVRGISWEELRRRRGDWGRDLAWYLGQRECGLALRELGELSGGVDYATVSAGARRMERRLANDKALAQKAKQVENEIER